MTTGRSPAASDAPVIVRIAGLPADIVRGTDLGERISRAKGIESRLATARRQLLERIHEAVPGAPSMHRGFLLTVKRDCYNGRTLNRHRGAEGWNHLKALAPKLVVTILDLEAMIETERREFSAAYEEASRAEASRLGELLDDRLFSCGLAIASPVVAGQSRRLTKRCPRDYRRREKKLVPTLLRYISRAALKLSPFSTFTPVGLGILRCSAAEGRCDERVPVRLASGGWEETSLLRMRRYLLDQYWDMLCRFRPLRERLPIVLNDSRLPAGSDRISFLRPGHWRPEGTKLRYFEESLVHARLGGPVIEALLTVLDRAQEQEDQRSWRQLVDDLSMRLGVDEREVAGQVDRLVEVGLLHLLPPWPTNEAHLEKTMLRELRRLPIAHRLEQFLRPLESAVELEDGILESGHPGRDLRELNRLSEVLWDAAARLGGLDLDGRSDGQPHDFYQDVIRRPRRKSSHPEALASLAAIDRDAAVAALQSVEPLSRYSRVFDHRQDFLVVMGAILGKRWPDRSSFSLFEVFEAVREHWQDFVRFSVEARSDGRWTSTWNPLRLCELEQLDQYRRWVQEAISECMRDGEGGRRIDIPELDALLEQAPWGTESTVGGSCLFLQSAVPDGSLWVLNRLKEGTGRFASRYTALLNDAECRTFTTRISRHATLDIDGEPVELLDVQSIQGDTLNVHATQTPKLLTMPGGTTDLEAERRLRLSDLMVTLPDGGPPLLRDRDGNRYLAVHLGVGYHDYMPTVVKFLCLFGPSEMGSVFPPPWIHQRRGLRIRERTLIGNVVIHRKSWTAPARDLGTRLEGVSEVEAFEILSRWRMEHGIPERVFLLEAVPHALLGRRYKPQFIDFSSPGLVTICRSALQSDDRTFTLVEMLPTTEAFPRDADGRPWAVEVLLDSIALTPASHNEDATSHHPNGWLEPTAARSGGTTRRGPTSAPT